LPVPRAPVEPKPPVDPKGVEAGVLPNPKRKLDFI
jgi:hypothetical protein